MDIILDANTSLHRMAGGIGASWHAIGPDVPWYDSLICRHNRGARGSAFGANPPLRMERQWRQIEAYARWLGLSFVRVEFDRRMFEPERGRFTFDNEECRTLLRILRCCRRIGADVFFTHMHADVEWNAHPGVNRLQSAPRDVDAFVHGLGELCERLVVGQGLTCIKYLCLSNEPGGAWGWWLGADGKPCSLMPAVHAMRRELDRRKLPIKISGPDWCSLDQDTPDYDLEDPAMEALDAHRYSDDPEPHLFERWVALARRRGVPFFLSEYGAWTGPNIFTNPDPEGDTVANYDAQLVNVARVLGGLNLGVDGFNRWSFLNRGDLDGQFQLVNTWDRIRWQYLDTVTPATVPCYTFAILSRFLPKRSTVLKTAVEGDGELVAAAVRTPRGGSSLFLLNTGADRARVTLRAEGLAAETVLPRHVVTEAALAKSGFALEPTGEVALRAGRGTALTLPSRSVTALSNHRAAKLARHS